MTFSIRSLRPLILTAAALLPLAALVLPGRAATGGAKATSAHLHELFRSEWDYSMRQSPVWASILGDRRWNTQWGDGTLPAIKARYQHAKEALAKLKAIGRSGLPQTDRVNYDLFERHLRETIDEERFETYLLPVNQMFGIQTTSELAGQLRFETQKDFEDWIVRLQTFPEQIDQTIALMRVGIAQRRLHPKIVMQRVTGQIDKQIVAKAEDSPFFDPFKDYPAGFAPALRERLTAEASRAIVGGVVPAFGRFKRFFVDEYLPACFDGVGVWHMKDGDDYYAFQVWRETTTSLTPEEIHRTGLSEVARIRAQMEEIKSRTGFTGTLSEFFEHLRTDPKFYFKDAQEMLLAYRALCKKIDARLVKVFKVLPRMPYGVETIEEVAAPDAPAALYYEAAADGSRPGFFRVNTFRPEVRPRFDMVALALHEAVPGHHLQIALAMEQGALPEFRKYGGYTAFTEGWALYAESLGEDMDLYDDPYDKFGQLTFEMWRAVRLVVDTGIHYKRWTREQAIEFFKDNTPKSELDIVNEVDRYITWPAQALAYKLGELKIRELRLRAAAELGDRFDLREFHDVLLRDGSVTLEVLSANVDAWIGSKKRSHSKQNGH